MTNRLLACARLPIFAAVIILVACRNPTGGTNASACQQTYEFGNSGCFEVAGKVVRSSGHAASGIFVELHASPDAGSFGLPYQMTDTSGSFRLRAARMSQAPNGGGPDTMTVFVVASDLSTAGVGTRATVRDSARVVVTVAPVGSIPQTSQVQITLPSP